MVSIATEVLYCLPEKTETLVIRVRSPLNLEIETNDDGTIFCIHQ